MIQKDLIEVTSKLLQGKAGGVTGEADLLTGKLQSKLNNPESNSDFDLQGGVNEVLKDVGMSTADSGGKLSFYGSDPIIPSRFRFGSMAAIGLAAKAVAIAALWRDRTGEGQDISVDVRKALRRFAGFFDRKWETINGRAPMAGNPGMTDQVIMSKTQGSFKYVVVPKGSSKAEWDD